VRIAALAITPQRFLSVHDRPAQPRDLVIRLERREIVAVAAPERGVLLEQSLLEVEAEVLRFVILVIRVQVRERVAIDYSVCEQDLIERLAFVLRVRIEQIRGPYLIRREALRKFDDL